MSARPPLTRSTAVLEARCTCPFELVPATYSIHPGHLAQCPVAQAMVHEWQRKRSEAVNDGD